MLKSKKLSKYYTKNDAVNQCINLFLKNIIIKENDIIIEPSAGNGAFINKIKSITSNYLFLDIEPEHNEILKQDYLKMNYSQLDKVKGELKTALAQKFSIGHSTLEFEIKECKYDQC